MVSNLEFTNLGLLVAALHCDQVSGQLIVLTWYNIPQPQCHLSVVMPSSPLDTLHPHFEAGAQPTAGPDWSEIEQQLEGELSSTSLTKCLELVLNQCDVLHIL